MQRNHARVTKKNLEAYLGRKERAIDVSEPILKLQTKSILVTGAAGAIGSQLVPFLKKHGIRTIATDLEPGDGIVRMDIRSFQECLQICAFHEPDIIIHLAAEKLAPIGELMPFQNSMVTIEGTQNILNMGKKVVFSSTCKAADPEIAYGAGKLIAERMVLNYGGTVVRYYNVLNSGQNILSFWETYAPDDPLLVTPCKRYFMSIQEAIASTLWGCLLPSGRYVVDPGEIVPIRTLAERVHPGRAIEMVPPRRGDRLVEPRHASCEEILPTGVKHIDKIINPSDPNYPKPQLEKWTAEPKIV
jgi:FlaA1/EpsC-like NDP-sugar epimerase